MTVDVATLAALVCGTLVHKNMLVKQAPSVCAILTIRIGAPIPVDVLSTIRIDFCWCFSLSRKMSRLLLGSGSGAGGRGGTSAGGQCGLTDRELDADRDGDADRDAGSQRDAGGDSRHAGGNRRRRLLPHRNFLKLRKHRKVWSWLMNTPY